MGFLYLIAVVIFFATLLIAGLVFGYEYYLKTQIENLQAELQTELSKFEPSLVAELTRLDNRIESGKALLVQHVALSSFFEFLSRSTLKNVRFTSFNYSIQDNTIKVTMNGLSKSFASVALQSLEFLKPDYQKYLANQNFTSLNLDEKGNVIFTFTTDINPDVVAYEKLHKAETTVEQTLNQSQASSTDQTQ